MKISEIITDKYKLRIPPTVYYDLLADVREVEEEQEPQTFKWCTDCREYDQEKHCCHRWSKAIRDTVEEMKQEYIEREVLDKIKAEIKAKQDTILYRYDYYDYYEDGVVAGLDFALKLIDKAETEAEDGNED